MTNNLWFSLGLMNIRKLECLILKCSIMVILSAVNGNYVGSTPTLSAINKNNYAYK